MNRSVPSRLQSFVLIFLFVLLPSLCIELLDSFVFTNGESVFRYDRTLIVQGEWWRVLTGHFDHLGWNHLGLNFAFLILLYSLFDSLARSWLLLVLILVFSLFISFLMWHFSPEMSWYVGLSGALYGVLVYALWYESAYPLWLRIAVLIILLSKVMLEQIQGGGGMVSEFISGPIAVDAHLYGVMSGLIAIVMKRFISKRLIAVSQLRD